VPPISQKAGLFAEWSPLTVWRETETTWLYQLLMYFDWLRPFKTKMNMMIVLQKQWHNKWKKWGHSLEPPLAVLALVSHPSSVTDAGSVDAFPGETVLVARLGRRGVRGQHEVKQHRDYQVSVDSPQIAVGGEFGSKSKGFRRASPPGMHFFRVDRAEENTGASTSALGEKEGERERGSLFCSGGSVTPNWSCVFAEYSAYSHRG